MTLPPIGFVASSQHGIAKADQCSLATADPSAAYPHAAQDARCCRTEHQLVPCRADRHIKHTVQYVVHTSSIRPSTGAQSGPADGLAHPVHSVPAAWARLVVFGKVMLDALARQIRQRLAAPLLRLRLLRVRQPRVRNGSRLDIIGFLAFGG